MRERARTVAVLVAVAIVSIAATVYQVAAIRSWHERGWAGLSYLDADDPFLPGQIWIVFRDSPAHAAGIRRFDRIVAVDAIPIESQRRLRRLDRDRVAGDTIEFTIRRGSETFRAPVRLERPPAGIDIASMPLASLFLAIGTFVFYRKPRDEVGRVFLGICVTIAFGFLLAPMSMLTLLNARGITAHYPLDPSRAILTIAASALSVGLVVLFFHFALIFPRPVGALLRAPRLRWWIYLIPAMAPVSLVIMWLCALTRRDLLPVVATGAGVASALSWWRARSVAGGSLRRAAEQHPTFLYLATSLTLMQLLGLSLIGRLYVAWMVVSLLPFLAGLATAFLGYPIASALVLLARYRQLGYEERRQVQWPLWGIASAVALFTLLSIAGTILLYGTGYWSARLNTLISIPFLCALLFIPASFAIAILKYRLLDIQIVIRKTVLYSAISAVLILLYLGVSGLVTLLLVQLAALRSDIVTIASTLTVAAAFIPTRNRIQSFLEAHFFRRRQAYPVALQAIARPVSQHEERWQDTLCEHVQRALECRAVAWLRPQPGSRRYRVETTLGLPDEARAAILEDPRSERGENIVEAPEPARSALRASLIAFAETAEASFGAIAVGSRLSGESYDADDRQFLIDVTAQLVAPLEAEYWRSVSDASEEWRQLDRLSRLVYVIMSRGETPIALERLSAAVLEQLALGGVAESEERVASAIERLVDRGAIVAHPDRMLDIVRREWLLVTDAQRPLEQLVREGRERIGAFEIIERVGAGGMGEVFRALNVHDGSLAAVKLLPLAGSRDTELRRRLEREGEIVAAISHPNIVRLRARGEHEGRLYVAMDYVEGETVASALQRNALPDARVAAIALQIASALAELHQRGVVHRDVKSSNVMLTPEGRAVLLDFGLARAADSSTLTHSQAVLGTLQYMSPEQLRGEPVDARTDVWAFGIFLFEMLFGAHPWKAYDPVRLTVEILGGAPDLSVVANPALRDLLARLLQPVMDHRIPDGRALLDRLESLPIDAFERASGPSSTAHTPTEPLTERTLRKP